MKQSLRSENYVVMVELLKAARLAASVTQMDLASRLGIEQSVVSKCERGARRLDILELRAWLAALQVPFARFCDDLDQTLTARALARTADRTVAPRRRLKKV